MDGFRTVSDGFGSCRTVFGLFSNRFRSVSDRFGRLWCAFGPFSDDSTQNLKISNFNWPGLGPVRAVPSVRAVPPSPGQLKFEILRKFRKKTERKRKRKRNGIFVSQNLGDVVRGNTGSQKLAQIIVSSGNLQISIIVSSVGQKTSKNIPKQSKIWVNFRCFSNTSERIRMHPNVSERIQMGPNRSDEVRTRPKTSKNVENDPKPSEKIPKIRDRRATGVCKKKAKTFTKISRVVYEIFAKFSKVFGSFWKLSEVYEVFGRVRMRSDVFELFLAEKKNGKPKRNDWTQNMHFYDVLRSCVKTELATPHPTDRNKTKKTKYV